MRLERIQIRMGEVPFPQYLSFRTAQALSLAAALLPVIFLWGCSAAVSKTSLSPQSTQTFSISGTISPTAGGSGATVSLSGASTGSTTSDSSGNYTFTGLSNGVYAVTPSKSGFAFTPTSQSATVSGATVTGLNFTAGTAHSVALSWNSSTSAVVGYNVYRSIVSGNQYGRVNSALIGSLSFTDSGLQSGSTYYYVTTAVDANGNESTFSNQVTANIP
jgi:carboxypeptidase family protein/fibronectin type III domain protein